ncbi:hypothetical protein CHELA1G11_12128 [Hyphomicrobiales bacterium]|nr:hypothetical protein CHELA1G11_12128 [Hyphomicrobiales bacterium]CAH1663115.1 hypothetical protein CHELA1G2_12186 [Hyphomicrobiales bacterium]
MDWRCSIPAADDKSAIHVCGEHFGGMGLVIGERCDRPSWDHVIDWLRGIIASPYFR